jgi:hypothetical protein
MCEELLVKIARLRLTIVSHRRVKGQEQDVVGAKSGPKVQSPDEILYQ